MKKKQKNFFLCICLFMGDMKFFIENQRVEKEVEWVKNQVRLHMNGATTSQMEQGGIHYRLNYGVAVPHLKQLAKRIPVSYELAERLWFLEIRETMLLAALIVPAEEMTLQRCEEWASKIDNKDLVERTSMFLWARVGVLDELLPKWLVSQDANLAATALYTIGRYAQQSGASRYKAQDIIDVISKRREQLLYMAGSFALRMLMRVCSDEVEVVRRLIQDLKELGEANDMAIAGELQAEIDFLEESR